MKELILNQSPPNTILVDDETKIVNFPFGIWAKVKPKVKNNAYVPTGLLKLVETNASGIYFAFYKMDGKHSGWGNYKNLKDCLCNIREHYIFVAPETKQELLDLLRDNL
jgi:hypothetical protein